MEEIKKIATMNGWYVKPIKKKNSVIGFHFTNATENGFTEWELKDNVIGLGNVILIDSDSLYFFISEKNRDWFWNHKGNIKENTEKSIIPLVYGIIEE